MLESIASRSLLPACLIAAFALTGCQAERPVIAPVDPEWSYHDGSDSLSNNDAWEKMIPASALLRYDEDALASVEESTAE